MVFEIRIVAEDGDAQLLAVAWHSKEHCACTRPEGHCEVAYKHAEMTAETYVRAISYAIIIQTRPQRAGEQ